MNVLLANVNSDFHNLQKVGIIRIKLFQKTAHIYTCDTIIDYSNGNLRLSL